MVTHSEEHAAMGYLIEAHLDHIKYLGQAERTIDARRNVLWRLHHHLPLGIAYGATKDIQRWLGQYTGWSLYTYDGHARAFYGWADGVHLDGDPMLGVPRPKRPRCLPNPVTDEELAYALANSDPWWQLVIHLASLEALRASEIADLRRQDVNAETVFIRCGKGGHPGSVPTHPHIWRLVTGMPRGHLVRGAAGQTIDGRYLSARARGHFDRIGMREIHLHRFRDWCATTMLNSGHTIRAVQENLRHRNLSSTEIYTQVTDRQRRLAVQTLPVLTGPQQRAG